MGEGAEWVAAVFGDVVSDTASDIIIFWKCN